MECGRQGKPSHSRLPITPSILRRLKSVWMGGNPSYDAIMLWSASLTTFFSFCRSGEITVGNESKYDPNTHLSFGDVAMDNAVSPSAVSRNIKYSKTNTGRHGYQVVLGSTNDDLCPVAALLAYLAQRGDKPGALSQWRGGTPLSKSKFVEAIRQAMSAAHLPAQDYAGHSFRIGAATTTAMAGIQDSTIQTLGWWKSASYLLYI